MGRVETIQRRKVIALLAYLAVTARPQSRDTLATLLWSEYDQTNARANLRRDLYWLKKAIGETYLEIDGEQVSIPANPNLWLDVTEFRELMDKALQHGHQHTPDTETLCAECQNMLEGAVSIYHADFMHGFSLPDSPVFEEWQFFESESLRQKLAEALQMLIKSTGAASDYKQAITYCRRWLALDPLHEPAHRQLMILYAMDGQRAAALRQYGECEQLLESELGLEPEEGTRQLFQAIQAREFGPGVDKPKLVEPDSIVDLRAVPRTQAPKKLHNLPQPSTSFIGRDDELALTIAKLKDPDCRILTILGPGGSGKTRLAIQVGFELTKDDNHPFNDGIWFVQLASLTDSSEISLAIERAFNVSFPAIASDRDNDLLIYLSQRESLVILDNFEHLQNNKSAELLSRILTSAPDIKLLLTSRLSANLKGEHLIPIAGLEIPPIDNLPQDQDLASSYQGFSALRLFEQSASRVQANFKIDRDNFYDVAKICQRVQGMPLAIELAATWLELLPVNEINAEIERSLDFLETDWHDLPDRQRSLRAVFNASWSMLSETARPVIKALSAFRSSFTRQAAQRVSGASSKTLLELINKSWVQKLDDSRYQMHELLRQFTFEQLEREPITFAQVKEKYCTYYAERFRLLWEDLKGPSQIDALETVALEFENLTTAWHWLIAAGQAERAVQDILPPLLIYAEIRSKSEPLLKLIDDSMESLVYSHQPDINQKTLTILLTAMAAFYRNGFPIRLETFALVHVGKNDALQRAWSLANSAGNLHALGFWGVVLAYIYGRIIDRHIGIESLEQIIALYRAENGYRWELGIALLHISMLLLTIYEYRPDAITIQRYLDEAQNLFTALGDGLNSAYVLRQRGNCNFQMQDLHQSIYYLKQAQARFLELGETVIAADVSWQIGDMQNHIGEHTAAIQRYCETIDIYLERGLQRRAARLMSKASYESLRYGGFEVALDLRQRSLELAEIANDPENMAWSIWEMGDLKRVVGDFREAGDWYERAYPLFEDLDNKLGLAFYQRGLGDLALATQDYQTAREHFAKSLEYADIDQIGWLTSYALNGLGQADLGLGMMESAGNHFLQAVKKGRRSKDRGVTLVALLGLASYFAAAGNFERAFELAYLVKSHFATWNETSEAASQLLTDVAGKLPSDRISVLQSYDEDEDLWLLIDRITAENSDSMLPEE